MKKALFFVSCAAFVAAMTLSCNNNNVEEAVEDTIVEEVVEEPVEAVEQAAETTVEATAMSEAEHAAMLDAARQAGQAKCNCYKTDAASVEACIRSILSEKYAQYQNNSEFKAAMEAEFNSCVKAKVAEATKKEADKAIQAGANAIAKKIGNK